MIIEVLLNIFFGIINSFLTLLPVVPVFSYAEGIMGFVEIIGYGGIFINMTVFITCLGVWFAFWRFEFVYGIAEWLWKKIPGIG